MSQYTVYMCDRCMTKGEDYQDFLAVFMPKTVLPKEKADLCPACIRAFKDFMKIRGPIEG
jgi:hypothetical protein